MVRFLSKSKHSIKITGRLILTANAAVDLPTHSTPGGCVSGGPSTDVFHRDCRWSGAQHRGNREKTDEEHRKPFKLFFPFNSGLSAYLAVIWKNTEGWYLRAAVLCTSAHTFCTLPTALSHSLILILANLNAWGFTEKRCRISQLGLYCIYRLLQESLWVTFMGTVLRKEAMVTARIWPDLPLKKTKKLQHVLNDKKIIFVYWTKAWRSLLDTKNGSSFVVSQPRKTAVAQHGMQLN